MDSNVQGRLSARSRVGRFAIVGLMLSLWLGSLAVAACPELHQLLHRDAQNLDHHCLITQIKQHSLLAGFTLILTPLQPSATFQLFRCAESQFVPVFDYQACLSRGPPSVFSSTTVVG